MDEMNEEFIESIKEVCLQNLENHKSLMPVLFLNSDEEIKIIGIPEFNDEIKDQISEMLLDLIRQERLKEFAFVSENWSVSANTIQEMQEMQEWKDINGSFEGHPSVKEMVTVIYSSPQKDVAHVSNIIRDDEGGFKELSDWEIGDLGKPDPTMNETRFNHLWVRGSASNN
jgi:hypothetical protein